MVKFVSASAVAASLGSSAVLARSESNNDAPTNAVSKLVEMLKDMKGKMEREDKADEAAFDKYMCWCDRVQESKSRLIKEAEGAIEMLSADIKENEGEKIAQEAELQDIGVKQTSTEEHKSKEIQEYNATHSAFLVKQSQQTQILQALHKSVGLLGKSPLSFLQVKGVSKKSQRYSPKSLTVSGVLEDMQKNFGKALDQDAKADEKATESHKGLVTDLTSQLDGLHKSEVKTKVDKAETETTIADDQELKLDTSDQKEADAAFLVEAEQSCTDRRTEYNERTELRLKELDGVTKALDSLTDEKNRALFLKSMKSFLQQGSTTAQQAAAQRASAMLEAVADERKSFRLGALARKILLVQKGAPNGNFQTVLESIAEMMKQLKAEGEADAEKKDYCNAEYQKINSERNKKQFLIQKNQALIKRLDSHVEGLIMEKAKSQDAINTAEKDLSEARAIREEENSVFKTEKADDEAAVAALTSVRATLAELNNAHAEGDGTALAQVSLQFDPKKLSNERRDLMRDEEKYQLTDKSSQKGALATVLAMVDHIIASSEKEIETASKAEDSSQKSFEAQEKDTKALVEDLKKKIVSIDGQMSSKKQESSSENGSLESNQEELDAQKEYEESLKPECDWIISKFDERYNKREAEMTALEHVKYDLSTSALVQKGGK
eukprot:TRINITY_DN1414_c2_g1_i1.p1 TRINITY_DN1414_c2_g1~~TRINITY_DN1414_c2_g1_i1.p1  ORF type:complete len:666 (+),score=192.50 TRINITY_DN1414_c2_g1_i1:64-2061(+)